MKRLKTLNSPQLPKRQFFYNAGSYPPAILLASLLGTYSDLYFVGKGMYEFPIRPFPTVFSINIAFTLFGLPLFTWLYLILMKRMNRWRRLVFILFLSLTIPALEKMSEHWGFFQHSNQWSHIYSYVGYFLFFVMIWKVFNWSKNDKNRG